MHEMGYVVSWEFYVQGNKFTTEQKKILLMHRDHRTIAVINGKIFAAAFNVRKHFTSIPPPNESNIY